MKIIRRYFILVLFWSVHCSAIDITDLFQAIDREDSSAIICFFDQIDLITVEEGRELITNFYEYYADRFGSDIFNNGECLNKLDYFIEIYNSILSKPGFFYEKNMIHKNNMGFDTLFCQNKKIKKEKEVPSSMILGGVEILGGSLVWVLPFPGAKQLGGIMIADGVRRTFDGLEEIDKENKKEQYPFDHS